MTEENFKPGSFGCHEALHMAGFLADCVDSQLCNHPSILDNQRWHQLALDACTTLNELYEYIGAVHGEDTSDEHAG